MVLHSKQRRRSRAGKAAAAGTPVIRNTPITLDKNKVSTDGKHTYDQNIVGELWEEERKPREHKPLPLAPWLLHAKLIGVTYQPTCHQPTCPPTSLWLHHLNPAAPWAAYEVGAEEEQEGSKEAEPTRRPSSFNGKVYNRKEVAPFAFEDKKNGSAKEKEVAIHRQSVIGKKWSESVLLTSASHLTSPSSLPAQGERRAEESDTTIAKTSRPLPFQALENSP